MTQHSVEFFEWLRTRRSEMEEAALARVCSVSDPASVEDPEYAAGLRTAVSAALEYGLIGIELGEDRTGPTPAALLIQARSAARSGVSLETVLRRYISGYSLLGDFVMQAFDDDGLTLQATELRRVWRIQATLLDRLVDAITTEYRKEIEGRLRTNEERRAERVKKLLDGRLLELDDLHYEFDAWHIGMVAQGPSARPKIRKLASDLDRHLLAVSPGDGTIWAWLGGRDRVTAGEAEHQALTEWRSGLSLALGEPERGIAGWRLTHRQARSALPIAQRVPAQVVRYADVALLATALHDDVLAISLQRLYLDPLAYEQDGGASLRSTLRAYFAAQRNVSSTAAALGLSRQTVSSRLRVVEKRICRSLDTCASEVDTALRLERLGHFQSTLMISTALPDEK